MLRKWLRLVSGQFSNSCKFLHVGIWVSNLRKTSIEGLKKLGRVFSMLFVFLNATNQAVSDSS